MLSDVLASHGEAIVKQWIELTLDTYPADAQRFLHGQRNPFANPIGNSIKLALSGMYDWLCSDAGTDEIRESVDEIVRIRAVQDFSAADAVNFVFFVKKLVRDVLDKEAYSPEMSRELAVWEGRVDELALVVFEIYVQCREKIFDLRAKELKRQTGRILQRACQIWDAGKGAGSDSNQLE